MERPEKSLAEDILYAIAKLAPVHSVLRDLHREIIRRQERDVVGGGSGVVGGGSGGSSDDDDDAWKRKNMKLHDITYGASPQPNDGVIYYGAGRDHDHDERDKRDDIKYRGLHKLKFKSDWPHRL